MCSRFCFFHGDTGRNHKCPNVSFFFLICWTAIRTRRHIQTHEVLTSNMKVSTSSWMSLWLILFPCSSFVFRSMSNNACLFLPSWFVSSLDSMEDISSSLSRITCQGTHFKVEFNFGILVCVFCFVFSSNLKTLTLNVKSWRTFKVSSWIRPSPKRW